MIHICYSISIKNNNYIYLTATSIYSLLENTTDQVTLHIFHDHTLNEEYKYKLENIVLEKNQKIIFYLVTQYKEVLDKLSVIKKYINAFQLQHFTFASFFRLFMCKILQGSIEKCIYLDSDTIINIDIKELYDENLDGCVLGAVSEYEANKNQEYILSSLSLVANKLIPAKKYFNSGILLIDLTKITKYYDLFFTNCLKIYKDYNCANVDQEILNMVFWGKYKELNNKYNIFIRNRRFLHEYKISNGIFHYLSNTLLQNYNCDAYDLLFIKYFSKTKFFNEKTIQNIFFSYSQVYNDTCKKIKTLLSILVNKNILIFYDELFNDLVVDYFPTLAKFQIKIIDNTLYFNEILDMIKSSNNSISLFFSRYYNFLKQILEQSGLSENINFINGEIFINSIIPKPIDLLLYKKV